MKQKSIKLELSDIEKRKLKACKVRATDLCNYSADYLCAMLDLDKTRAMEIRAQAEFQHVPSIGIRFAQDLISMGYYSFDQLIDKDGARLTEEFEQMKGYWIDPCVEDQFRLAVYYATTKDTTKKWWDFTAERRQYRLENGYPADRPTRAWHEVTGMK